MRDLYISAIYFSFLLIGPIAPFVFALGYIWTDTFSPQLATDLLATVPVSLIMGVATILGYVVLDRRSPPRLTAATVLTLLFAIWVTLTLLWAVAPEAALEKWNWAFKTLVFSAFIPFFIRSRIQIEAFLSVYVFALVVQFMPTGIKTIFSGGGYGAQLGVEAGNSGLAEGGALATVSLMAVPLLLFLRAHGQLVPKWPFRSWLYLGVVVAALLAAVGTYERTALIGLAVVGGWGWLKSRRKILFGLGGIAAVALILAVTSQRWDRRMSTIETYQSDSSAMVRLLVWKWTLNFVGSHPFGGGFNAYVVDEIDFPGDPAHPAPIVQRGRAFHNIYFEVLGEHGYVGIAIFLSLIATTFASLMRIARKSRGVAELAWCRDLANALQVSLLVVLTCGCFIGIAFQPVLYYLFAATVCLKEWVRRALKEESRSRRPSYGAPVEGRSVLTRAEAASR